MKSKDGLVKFGVFNQEFWNYYYNFQKENIFHLIWIIWASFCLGIGIVIDYYIFEEINIFKK